MTEFDQKAATWDDDPDKVSRANAIADSLAETIDLSKIKSALEYGSGTGLLSFALQDRLGNIALMDESLGMTEVAIQKCKERGVEHLNPVQYDLLNQALPESRFDLIFILLTLHHIKDTAVILQKFNQLLNKGGYLAIIDLVKEDGSFHEHNYHFHNGFERTDLESQLRFKNLEPISYEVCCEIGRDYDNGNQKYPLFLLVSQKQD